MSPPTSLGIAATQCQSVTTSPWMARDLQGRVRAAPDQVVAFVAEAHGRLACAAWLVFKPGSGLAGAWAGPR